MDRVIVVGGGLAGIAAALDCADAGARVTLLEARPRLGGAAYSTERHGLAIDNGQHVFLRCCDEYRGLLQRIGASEMVTLQERLAIPVLAPGRPAVWLRRDNVPAPLHLARSLLGFAHLSVLERAKAGWAMQALQRVDPDSPSADAQALGPWLRAHGQSPRAIACLWELIVRATINLTADESSLAQAAYVFQTGLLANAAAGDIGWAIRPLSEIHDVAARAALERAGVGVGLGARTERITPHDDGGFRVKMQSGPVLRADAVIVAVQHHRVAKLLPESAELAAPAEALGHSPIVNLHVIYDRPVLEHPFAAGVDSPVQWVCDRTRSAGLDQGQYLAVSLSAADADAQADGDALRERYTRALAELLPAARGATVTEFFHTREHHATFRAAPGSRRLRPGPATRWPGLALAGTWTDTGWPATMESAVRSGRAAARHVLPAVRPRPQLQYQLAAST